MDKYRIDSHKLLFHPQRVADWLNGKQIYPLYMEASPSGACNHRCIMCGLDFMGYVPKFYDVEKWDERLREMSGLGLKSIMYAGEGEPFLHKRFSEIVSLTKKAGVDVAITTNAVLFTPEKAVPVMRDTSWIKVSINAGTPATYAKIHRTNERDFKTVMTNMAHADSERKRLGLGCTLGMQMLLLPENAGEAVGLAQKAKETGMDYLVIKPYSQHPQSITNQYSEVEYRQWLPLSEELDKISDNRFQVIFRINTMIKWDEKEKPYDRCCSLPFWSYVDSEGFVWGCSMYLRDERFRYGNLFQTSFKEIWEGPARKKNLEFMEKELDPGLCRINCRMDEVNRYLWELMHPAAHVNFI